MRCLKSAWLQHVYSLLHAVSQAEHVALNFLDCNFLHCNFTLSSVSLLVKYELCLFLRKAKQNKQNLTPPKAPAITTWKEQQQRCMDVLYTAGIKTINLNLCVKVVSQGHSYLIQSHRVRTGLQVASCLADGWQYLVNVLSLLQLLSSISKLKQIIACGKWLVPTR